MSRHVEELLGIVGLGAVGGSLASALRDRVRVVAWSRDQRDREAAQDVGIDVHSGDDTGWPRAMQRATAVCIAVPLTEIRSVVRDLRPYMRDDALLLHTASLQRQEALGLSEEEFARVLGTHPMAGSEGSGFSASRPDMFADATIRADGRANDRERARIERVWRAAGCSRVIWSDPDAHDVLMAYVSHLPQLGATALGALLAELRVKRHDLGPGGRDMTRLASSDPHMWMPLLEHAPRETADAVRRLGSALAELSDALERRDAAALSQAWARARVWGSSAEDAS